MQHKELRYPEACARRIRVVSWPLRRWCYLVPIRQRQDFLCRRHDAFSPRRDCQSSLAVEARDSRRGPLAAGVLGLEPEDGYRERTFPPPSRLGDGPWSPSRGGRACAEASAGAALCPRPWRPRPVRSVPGGGSLSRVRRVQRSVTSALGARPRGGGSVRLRVRARDPMAAAALRTAAVSGGRAAEGPGEAPGPCVRGVACARAPQAPASAPRRREGGGRPAGASGLCRVGEGPRARPGRQPRTEPTSAMSRAPLGASVVVAVGVVGGGQRREGTRPGCQWAPSDCRVGRRGRGQGGPMESTAPSRGGGGRTERWPWGLEKPVGFVCFF